MLRTLHAVVKCHGKWPAGNTPLMVQQRLSDLLGPYTGVVYRVLQPLLGFNICRYLQLHEKQRPAR